ncbi:MAG: aconitate hydratase, partial [Candidatus Dechloromonas phosphoritropha]
VRIKNLMLPPNADGSRDEGGITVHQPSGERLPIYDAAMRYMAAGEASVVFAGEEYGSGSSRDWAAKGTLLLGVRAVIAQSFERIHRSNLVGMGVMPLQFLSGVNAQTLHLVGNERFDIMVANGELKPQQNVGLRIFRADGSVDEASVLLRIDTPIEVEYFRHGGILPYVLRELLA